MGPPPIRVRLVRPQAEEQKGAKGNAAAAASAAASLAPTMNENESAKERERKLKEGTKLAREDGRGGEGRDPGGGTEEAERWRSRVRRRRRGGGILEIVATPPLNNVV